MNYLKYLQRDQIKDEVRRTPFYARIANDFDQDRPAYAEVDEDEEELEQLSPRNLLATPEVSSLRGPPAARPLPPRRDSPPGDLRSSAAPTPRTLHGRAG